MNKQHLNILIESEIKDLTRQQIQLLDICVNGDWDYENGIVDVEGSVDLQNQKLVTIPVQFGTVTEQFMCSYNKLTSLKGCPHTVGSEFWCDHNQLTSLEYMPTEFEFMDCGYNPFILNDKLFENLKRAGTEEIFQFHVLKGNLKAQIPIQFGITDDKIIDEIWQSYMNILEGKSE